MLTSHASGRKQGWFYRKALPICTSLEQYHPVLWKKSFRLFEICDFTFTPNVIRETCQDILTTEWTSRVPFFHYFIQLEPPAFTAAKRLDSVIREIYEKNTERVLDVFEFCAGSSGPTPMFERLINQHRTSNGEQPIRFTLSDLYPNHQAWEQLAGSSPWLDFEHTPVDATDPPLRAISRGSTFHKPSNKL